jgi:phosphopantothenoylcysteine decarboxylase/phosphopantothenate--cysteine ligase
MNDNILSGKKIVLGVTGCIAAYKSAYLIRELVKRGCEVKVIMTPSALQFITPLTLSTLSGNEVIVNIFPESQADGTAHKTWHIDLALWADLIMVAPCTINTAAKIAHGFADNALTTVIQAARTPVIISPAADVDMYQNKATQKNFALLEELGYFMVPAEEGELASGLSGKGRFPEIDKIIDAAELVLSGVKKDLTGKKILVTAGPTYEDIDPVRYIGNRSSGKMGYAIAKAAYLRGADVTLISGPVSEAGYPEIKLIHVRSAEEMKNAVTAEIENNNVLIMSAAVADYTPADKALKKIKKEDNLPVIELKATEDILANLKANGRIIAGFALETDNELENAKKKLAKKNLDMIVLNSLNDKSSGFEYNTNKITILKKDGGQKEYPLLSKFTAANHILTEINMISKK